MYVVNDALNIVIESAKELYPNKKAIIQYNPNLKKKDKVFGTTTFSSDGNIPVIDVSTDIPFAGMIDVLAHELAHVIAGEDAEHNAEWEKVYEAINNKYHELLNKKKDELCEKYEKRCL